MNVKVKARTWLAGVAVAVALALTGARCARDVELGVDPGSDAGVDAADAAAGADGAGGD